MPIPDDPKMQKLLREYPDFPVELVAFLYRMDNLIEEAKYKLKEMGWEQGQLQKKRDKIVEGAMKQLDKMEKKK